MAATTRNAAPSRHLVITPARHHASAPAHRHAHAPGAPARRKSFQAPGRGGKARQRHVTTRARNGDFPSGPPAVPPGFSAVDPVVPAAHRLRKSKNFLARYEVKPFVDHSGKGVLARTPRTRRGSSPQATQQRAMATRAGSRPFRSGSEPEPDPGCAVCLERVRLIRRRTQWMILVFHERP